MKTLHCSTMRVQEFVRQTALPPAAAVLLDRLWPRGVRKEALAGVAWEKEATPSTELRQWFHADPDGRFEEFQQRFAQELQQPPAQAALARIRHQAKATGGAIVLLTAAKNPDRSHLVALKKALLAKD